MKCEACGSLNNIKIHSGTRDNPNIDVYKCLDCELKFLNKEEIDEKFYEEGKMHNTFDINDSIEQRLMHYEKDDKRKVDEIKSFIQGKRVCDFGCGYGGSISHIQKYASEIDAVEVEKDAVEYLRKKGIPVEENIEDYGDRKFDVITLFHVFEHLQEPKKWLQTFSKSLKQNGILFLEVPHANDALIELYHCKEFENFTYWSPHLYLYSEKNLKLILKDSDFEIEEINYVQRYPLSNHLYWLSNGKPGGDKVWNKLNNDELNKNYECILRDLKMTDTVTIKLVNKK